ncbi:hypothetical protein [Spirosoma litoris]
MTDPDYNNPDIFYWRGSKRYIYSEYIQYLVKNKLIVYPLEGGLVLGPSHDEGGIQIIGIEDREFVWLGEMEGLEYLFNAVCSSTVNEKLRAINSDQPGHHFFFEEYKAPSDITVIDCRAILVNGQYISKWIGFGGYSQWIINKTSTKANLRLLHELNLKTWNGGSFIQNNNTEVTSF